MRTAGTIPLLAALVVAAIAPLACGDGGSSVQEFRTDANRVCRDAERELDRIQRRIPSTADQAERQAAAIADVAQQALDNLRRIEPPDQLDRTYERYLDAREDAIGFIEDSRAAAAENDADAYERGKRRLAEGQPTRRQLALQLGLSRCSRPSLPSGQ